MTPPLWRESRVGLEAAKLLRSPIYRGDGVTDGRGQPVLLVPGFLAGDDSLSLMTRWLRRNGYQTSKAGVRANVACSGAALAKLEARLEALVERQGRAAAVIGQSRGGTLGKALAQLRPDLVSGLVTLGAPLANQLAVHPLVRLNVLAVGALGTIGAPGLFKHSCLKGECCAEFREALEAPLPTGIGFISIYSRSDGICDWRHCTAPGAHELEVRSSHIGMAVHRDVYTAIAAALPSFAKSERRKAAAKVTPLRRAA
jgi:pimeloyl-ACP methyl ester carboxylesterase